MKEVPVVDIFAGPGGLGEGFSCFEAAPGHFPFRISLSIEKDANAHQTLRLRSFFRHFPRSDVPELFYQALRQEFPVEELPQRLKIASPYLFQLWEAADAESMQAELGAAANEVIRSRISKAIGRGAPWVLIGGPPCQAYSIAGRVRNLGKAEYRIENDHRSSLYREYLRIIADHWPSVFVMENVKGLLSATADNQLIFDRMIQDLQSPRAAFGGSSRIKRSERYRIVPVVHSNRSLLNDFFDPRDYIVECERYGVPQVRHRLILVGIREDLGEIDLPQLEASPAPTMMEIIGDLPKLRSGVSRSRVGAGYLAVADTPHFWRQTIIDQTTREPTAGERRWLKWLANGADPKVYREIVNTVRTMKLPRCDRGSEFVKGSVESIMPEPLRRWVLDERLGGVCNHQARSHLDSDLARYLYSACFAAIHGRSPRLSEFPTDIQPDHENAGSGDFQDRFRVQVAGRPSTTITSHISKDGHYFIHPDPMQCRSLSV